MPLQVRGKTGGAQGAGNGPLRTGRVPERAEQIDTQAHERGVPQVRVYDVLRVQKSGRGHFKRVRVGSRATHHEISQRFRQVQVVRYKRRGQNRKQISVQDHRIVRRQRCKYLYRLYICFGEDAELNNKQK